MFRKVMVLGALIICGVVGGSLSAEPAAATSRTCPNSECVGSNMCRYAAGMQCSVAHFSCSTSVCNET